MTKQQWLIAGVGLAAIAALGWLWRASTKAPVAVPEAANLAASTSTAPAAVASPTTVTTKPFPLNAADTIASWSFGASYTNADAIAVANTDIAKLTGNLGKGKYDDYDLYNGIANDYGLLGDGKAAYQYYNRSIAIHPKKGLAYANLAHLMDELGAYRTAADAYAKAAAVEPGMLEYHIERLNYLTRQFESDNARILAAFTDASKQFGDNASILAIEAEWLTGQKRYADAIAAWERAKLLSPGKDTSAIDAEIARLKAKQ